mmetsp:Transcript_27723/g.50367  ORF Transcript_27723/g.50367 Transcript_27723/m.50367 type:complete len:103 (-) Transcript_27723:193-501(-)
MLPHILPPWRKQSCLRTPTPNILPRSKKTNRAPLSCWYRRPMRYGFIGSMFNVSDLAASYDSITTEDVTSAFAALVKSSPSMAAVGDIASVPYHATVAARFS